MKKKSKVIKKVQLNHDAEPGNKVERELNLSLTAKEAGYVSLALSRLKDYFTDYISLMESKRVADFDKFEYEVNIGEIETIMEKIARMADGTR